MEAHITLTDSDLDLFGLPKDSGDKVINFINKMKWLLNTEQQAEIEESASLLSEFSFKELEKRNLALTKLFIKHVSTGIYGRILLHLNRPNKEPKDKDEDTTSKMRRFSPGDIVGIF